MKPIKIGKRGKHLTIRIPDAIVRAHGVSVANIADFEIIDGRIELIVNGTPVMAFKKASTFAMTARRTGRIAD